ncbi:uncharacterized protein PHALS_12240 [Plasmopara halstedii]|uniref:Uncharacterized protein n=1 Tax=Plasmopara halstedii TaxID=4781 RepID=A0A0P1ALX3_PLAHL|nr:uncharacterized protein PHALS_12240 [Plasmopara halstedii]CEG41928.1 hypothetical protein PHALS_12240 [Plasmopara halstedii]|eukprot:XP_024578297.1 hypothetical protein PHALS_12240 [Plasmopara halstedii]
MSSNELLSTYREVMMLLYQSKSEVIIDYQPTCITSDNMSCESSRKEIAERPSLHHQRFKSIWDELAPKVNPPVIQSHNQVRATYNAAGHLSGL